MNRKERQDILISRGYLLEGENEEKIAPFFAVYLAEKFGVVVSEPNKLCAENVRSISEFFGLNVPDSFYNNPQDLTFYRSEELAVEQLVSYIRVELAGVKTDDPEVFARLPIFKKVLPSYKKGKEKVVRGYKIIDEAQADAILKEIAADYCAYTRPWSLSETDEFSVLLQNGYYDGRLICCKDNAINALLESGNVCFAKMLDRKDVVKMSVKILGDVSVINIGEKEKQLLKIALENAYTCVMTKKQAKYYNKIVKLTGADVEKVDNSSSPYVLAKKKLAQGDVVGAAEIFRENGSLLIRNVVWLLSRANADEAEKIIGMIDVVNKPIVAIQLLQTLAVQSNKCRVFVFNANGRFKSHIETLQERSTRRSVIGEEVKAKAVEALKNALKKHYAARPSLGKIYVSEKFRKVAIPMNTSATGKGLDVLPTGSRLPIKGDYIRAFCYWKNVYDRDLSVIVVDEYNEAESIFWGDFFEKKYGDSILSSGDVRGDKGAEYIDFKINEVYAAGCRYGVVFVNAYQDDFVTGESYCGYQDKNDLKTQAWSSKNIAMKIRIEGNTKQFAAFAFDFETREIIIFNLMDGRNKSIVDSNDVYAYEKYFSADFLKAFNIYDLLSLQGELVSDPAEADIVFDDSYKCGKSKKVVRPWDVEALIALI